MAYNDIKMKEDLGMELGLNNKVVFITGSTRGIGYATAESFLREGARVVVNGRKQESVNAACQALGALYGTENIYAVTGDMTKIAETNRAKCSIINNMQKIDILVPNLGTGKPISQDKLSIEEWQYMMDTNVYSAIHLIQTFLEVLKKQEKSSIIMISSIAAYEKIGAPYAYAASKSAILSLIKYLATDYAEAGIRVNGVVPGNIFYEGGRWDDLWKQNTIGTESYIEQNVPMGRFGKPREIADMIVFLASERTSFMTGNTVVIDGGQRKGY